MELLRYRIETTSLGRCLVASDDQGICAVSLADRDEALLEELAGRFGELRRVHGLHDWEVRGVLDVVAIQESSKRRASPVSMPTRVSDSTSSVAMASPAFSSTPFTRILPVATCSHSFRSAGRA